VRTCALPISLRGAWPGHSWPNGAYGLARPAELDRASTKVADLTLTEDAVSAHAGASGTWTCHGRAYGQDVRPRSAPACVDAAAPSEASALALALALAVAGAGAGAGAGQVPCYSSRHP